MAADKELQEFLTQLDFHRAGRRKAMDEAMAHDRAECRLLRKGMRKWGDKLGLDAEATAASFAPKED